MSDPPFDKDSFHRAVTNGDFSQAPLKQRFPLFYSGTSLFCCLPIPHSSMEPFKPLQDINKISIDFEKPRHMLFFRFKENSYFRRYLVAPSFESNHHKQDLLITTSRIYWSPQERCLIACSNFKL